MMQNFEQQAFLNPGCLVKVIDVYGFKHWVNKNQLEAFKGSERKLLHLFRHDGRRLQVKNHPGQFQFIHIDNIKED